jgi:hypothetical protein
VSEVPFMKTFLLPSLDDASLLPVANLEIDSDGFRSINCEEHRSNVL